MVAGFDPAAPFGPYTPPEGGPLECTIIVKAAPERSAKYGETVCTAGILDDGRLIRLYPVKIDEYWTKDIPKYSRVRIRAKPSDERAGRPESHKVEGGLSPSAESPLVRKSKAPWDARMQLINKAVNPKGMRGLRDLQPGHGTSLGIVKVRDLMDFYITAPLNEVIEQADYRVSKQKTLTGEPIMEGSRVDKLQHVFRYTWRCMGTCCDDDAEGQGCHDTTCEDWELFQAFRDWRKRYPDDLTFMEKLKAGYFDSMGQSGLHFAMGTPSDPTRQNAWMIVGLIYPNRPIPAKPGAPTLASRILDASDVVRPKPELAGVASQDLRTKLAPKAKSGQQRLG